MDASYKIVIEPGENRSYFKGDVTISDTSYSYEIRLAVPIDNIHEYTARFDEGIKKFREAVNIQIRGGGGEIELEDDEWDFFYRLLIPFIMAFIDRHDERLRKKFVKGMLSISITDGVLTLLPSAYRILGRPKFGFQLIDQSTDSRHKPS